MPQEKLNNLFQQKLEQLEAIPIGVGFNPSSAWLKLEERLHTKNKNYKRNRYAIAASVVVILFGVWLVKDDARISHQEVISHKPSGKIPKTISSVISKNQIASKVLFPKKQLHAATIAKVEHPKVKRHKHFIATIDHNIEQLKTPAVPTSKEPITLIIEPGTTVTTPPAKKFRIVHINEIEQSIQTAQRNTTAYTRFQFFKLSNKTFVNLEELQEEVESQSIRKDKGFIKAIVNQLKED